MKKPAQTVTLRAAEGETLIVRVHQRNLSADDAGVVEQGIRMYFWVAFALQEAKLRVKRLRDVLFGPSRKPQTPPKSAVSSTSRAPRGQGEGGGEPAPVVEVSGSEAGSETSEGEVSPTPTGGHRPGTGRLGADAYVGAERTKCRHEELAVGQRCPVCGQGT